MSEQHPPRTGVETVFDEEIEAEAHAHDTRSPDTMRDKREASLPETKTAQSEADNPTEEVMILGQ
ncbi:MAG TPA: hypothetical protein VIT91_11660 [Chthoniobacterales bacterium]